KCVATAADDGAVRLWDAESGRLIATLQRHKLRVRTVAFNHDGSYLVSASDDHTARVWQTRTGREIAIIGGHEGAIFSATFHPAGSFILTTSDDLTARLWSFEERGRATQDDPYALCSHNGGGQGRAPATQPGRPEALQEAKKRVPRCLTA